MNLLIVESPTKAKTISKYLGKGFVVRATFGHIKDLPEDELGVDLQTLRAKYVWIRGKKKILDQLKRISRKSKEIYIATDPDREGEAIAFFLKEELKRDNPNIKRIYFYEITEKAIRASLKNPTDVNMNVVKAQFARRILDRLIGYTLSPELSRAIGSKGLSVGRVQSPALRLIVEREREIQRFKKKEYYYIRADFEKEGLAFTVEWDYTFEKPENAKPFLEKIKNTMFEVKSIEKKIRSVEPPKPFITASLQAELSKLFGLSVDVVQSVAQKLYEEGYITYPRTDSYRMSKEKAEEFMEHIRKEYGKEYVGRLRTFREKPTSQLAHECIRPTSIIENPSLSGIERKIYDAIKNRTLASLSSPLKVEDTKLKLRPLGIENIIFEGTFTRLIFKGFLIFYPYKIEEKLLPNLEEGEVLTPKKVYLHKVQTKPPEPYTEGTLVKKLESLGIGRPSTYAVIVKTLKDRGYITVEKGYLRPTSLAFEVVDFLEGNYQALVDYSFTRRMEESLDKVEEGKEDYKKVILEMYQSCCVKEKLS